tara:strand:+ start:2828 stop:3838 length:1011 start_codon:yes stop_codon:yes gene_type:complete
MKISFRRTMAQRYRAVSHLIDPIIKNGHNLSIEVKSKKWDLSRHRKRPSDVSSASKRSIKWLIKTFNIQCNNLGKVSFSLKKNIKCDLSLVLDTKVSSGSFLAIPYVGFTCNLNGRIIDSGNPMCDLMRRRAMEIPEIPNTLLIVHPGGGRGFVSPVRKDIKKKEVDRNNRRFIGRVISNLPKTIEKIIIKPHPIPYIRCDKNSLKDSLRWLKDDRIKVSDDPIPELISKSEFVVNFGSSTAVWLLGSDKKWINIVGEGRYPYKLHRDTRSKADKWREWMQVVRMDKLKYTIANYMDIKMKNNNGRNNSIFKKYKYLYNIKSTDVIMSLIGDFNGK